MVLDIFVKNWVVGCKRSLFCCYGNTVFSGPFQTQKADSILLLLHKARGKLKVETCQFSDGKTFHIRNSKSSQEIVAIDYSHLSNKRGISLIF